MQKELAPILNAVSEEKEGRQNNATIIHTHIHSLTHTNIQYTHTTGTEQQREAAVAVEGSQAE